MLNTIVLGLLISYLWFEVGLAKDIRQAIAYTNDDSFLRRIYVTLNLELDKCYLNIFIVFSLYFMVFNPRITIRRKYSIVATIP